jgi:two-component system cell cycle response regulator
MSEAGRLFSVALFGFSEVERKILLGVFRLSEQRPTRYASVDTASGIAPKLLLVDADDPVAVADWKAANPHGQAVTVAVGQSTDIGPSPALTRPLQWGRLLKALDAAVAAARLVPGGLAAPESILVADTAPTARIFLKQRFEQLGCFVDFADDSTTAAALSEARRYAMVFVDAAIDGMDPYLVCKQLTARRLETGAPRVVMLSGEDAPFNRLRGAMSGCDGNLAKPIDEFRLNALITRYCPHLLQHDPSPVLGMAADMDDG